MLSNVDGKFSGETKGFGVYSASIVAPLILGNRSEHAM